MNRDAGRRRPGPDDGGRGWTVRPALPGDAAALAHVHVASWRWAYADIVDATTLADLDPAEREHSWRSRLERGARVLVVELSDDAGAEPSPGHGSLAGFVSWGPSRDDAPPGSVGSACSVGEVYSLYLDRAAQGRGVGAGLMRHAVAGLAREGFTEATLWVLEANALARRFYERNGWLPDGAVDAYTLSSGQALPELRYRRTIP